jgi:hypothetical protein
MVEREEEVVVLLLAVDEVKLLVLVVETLVYVGDGMVY